MVKIQQEFIAQKIYEIRGKRVMLSSDLAELYDVEIKVLNQQVRRNINRFPARYLFKLTEVEYKKALRSQIVTLNRGEHSKYTLFAFTEHGVLMLSSVLKSERAEKVNIVIIDTFVKLRELSSKNQDILKKIKELEQNLTNHDFQIKVLFDHIKNLLIEKEIQTRHEKRRRIGFNTDEKPEN